MAATINIEALWDQRYRDASVPFPVDGAGGISTDSSNNGKWLTTSAGVAVWQNLAIADADVASNAAIAVTKLKASVASVTGQALVTRAGVVTWEGGVAKLTYYARNYAGWHDDDNNDDLAAVQLALNDAVVTGGEVLIEARHGVWNVNGSSALKIPADLANKVVIRGLGMDATVIRLGLNTRTFLEPDGALTGNTHTYGNFEVRDLTIDNKNTSGTARPTSSAGHYGVLFSNAGIKANFADITIRRVKTKNVGPLTTAGQTSSDGLATSITQERRNFDITIGTTSDGLNGGTAYTIKRILLEDCDFGYSNPYNSGDGTGGGGNVGAIVQAFYGGADKVANKVYNTPWISNVYLEDISYIRCKWDSGQTPTSSTQPSVSGMGSAGFMIGSHGQGKRWLVEGCVAKNGGDPGYELDSGLSTTIRGCEAEDCWNVGFYLANIGGGADTNGLSAPDQHARILDCTARRVNVLNMQHLLVHQPKFATPFGAVTVQNFTAYGNLADLPVNGQNPVEFRGDIRKLTLRNIHVCEHITTTTVATVQHRAVSIALRGGRSIIDVDGIRDECVFTGSGGAGQFNRTSLALTAVDADLSIRNVKTRHQFTLSGGYTARSWQFDHTMTGGFNATDQFGASSGSLGNDYILDAGTLSDLTQTGGVLQSTANHSTEKRFIWLMASGNGSWQNIGPFTDQAMSIKLTPGPTLTSFKGGAIIKRSVTDATTYLECYVTDDGSQSLLKIDKVLAGSRTNLAVSSALGTRISNGVAFWVRGKIIGNLVTADYYTSAVGAISGSGATTLTATLTSSDIYTLGEQIQGRGGFVWTPQDAAATADDMRVDWASVWRGKFQECNTVECRGPATQAYGHSFEHIAGSWRFPGQLQIKDSDYTNLEGNTSIHEFQYVDSTQKQGMIADNVAYASPPAPSTNSTTSTQTTTNTTNTRWRVAIYGGTVSNVTLVDRAANTRQIASATGVTFTLAPGEGYTPTYTVAPTEAVVPIL